MVERIVAAVLVVSALVGAAYWAGGASPRAELKALADASAKLEKEYRRKEKAAYDAQRTIVEQFNAIRAADRDEWVHDDALRYRAVPTVRAAPRSNADVRGNCVEVHGSEGDRVLPNEPVAIPEPVAECVDQLQRAEQIAATLGLCQKSLQICADLK